MAGTPNAATGESGHFLTALDEASLAQDRSAQTDDSPPDTLEVRGDSMTILHGTLGRLRRPAVLAIVGTVVVVLAIGVGMALRGARQAPPSSV